MLIQSFLPNPIGKDTEGEYILLLNNSEASVNLSGWVLKDESGKAFALSGSLDAGESLSLSYARTKITLNNNGETVYLINPSGGVEHELGFTGEAGEGRVITETRALTEEQIETYLEPARSDIVGIVPAPQPESVIMIIVLSAAILSALSLWLMHLVSEDESIAAEELYE